MTIRCAVLIVSTNTDPVDDETVDALRALLRGMVPDLFFVEERRVASDRHLIEEILRRWCDEDDMDLVLTVGGTFPAPGLSAEQITPEATAGVLERTMPSLPETMRVYAVEEEPEALLDRGVAGIRARTLLVNLPGQAQLILLFAEAIADLIGPIVARLQPATGDGTTQVAISPSPLSDLPTKPRSTDLDGDEFAAFLAARRAEKSESESGG